MKKQYFFVSGLPRAGSTLLINILGQNPNFRVGGTSGIMDIIFGVRNNWDKLIEFKASPNEEGKKRVLRGILDNYYGETEHPVVFDKCRGWLSLLEMAEMLLEKKAKVLVPVRDLREILSSFEKLWRNTSKTQQISQESQYYFDFQTIEGRCGVWMRNDQPVGLACNRLKDALRRGFRDRLLFVEYKELTNYPKATMEKIYEFLEQDKFDHNFEYVEQITQEDDSIHGFKGLHQIKTKVEAPQPDYLQVLGPEISKQYAGPYIWS